MKVTKEKSEFGINIFLEEGKKCLAFTFGGNGDLYWSIHNRSEGLDKDYSHDSFIIIRENYGIYNLFEKLFLDIENINIFEDDIPFYIDTEAEIREYLKERKERLEEDKKGYRLHNWSNYNTLFDADSKTITWYSDETSSKVSNFLKIKKEGDLFKVEFYIQPYIRGYDEDFYSSGYIPIRFRNSGSSYEPFNLVFMRMYNSMQEVDDVNDIGHQIHIEEYLYHKEKVKKITK